MFGDKICLLSGFQIKSPRSQKERKRARKEERGRKRVEGREARNGRGRERKRE